MTSCAGRLSHATASRYPCARAASACLSHMRTGPDTRAAQATGARAEEQGRTREGGKAGGRRTEENEPKGRSGGEVSPRFLPILALPSVFAKEDIRTVADDETSQVMR